MVLHYLSFCLSVKLLISPSNLNDSFAGYRVFFFFFFSGGIFLVIGFSLSSL